MHSLSSIWWLLALKILLFILIVIQSNEIANQNFLCLPESFNTNIQSQFFDYKFNYINLRLKSPFTQQEILTINKY